MELILTKRDLFGDPDLPLALIPREPQPPYPLHSHDVCELVVVLKGSGIHFTETAEYEIGPGDVFVVHGGMHHGYRDLHDLVLVNLLYDETALEMDLLDLPRLPGYHALFVLEPRMRERHEFRSRLRLDAGALGPIQALVEALEAEIRERRPGYVFMAVTRFRRLVGELSRRYSGGAGDESRHLMRLAETLGHIEAHWRDPLSLAELTDIAHMSQSTLLRTFRKATGTTPVEYQTRLRVRNASRLLVRTGRSITDIAFECGFRDSNYFSRTFKKVTRVSPRQYRKTMAG